MINPTTNKMRPLTDFDFECQKVWSRGGIISVPIANDDNFHILVNRVNELTKLLNKVLDVKVAQFGQSNERG
jgi:hypothetical protein